MYKLQTSTLSQIKVNKDHKHNHPPSRSSRISLAREFINQHRAASLATVDSQGRPNVNIVYCISDTDLSIYFSTRVEGRKFTNILESPYVAMAFQNEENVQMLQLTGKAQRVNDLYIEQKILLELMQRRYLDPDWPPPPFKLFTRGSTNEIAIVKVIPAEMTYANFKTSKIGKYKPFFQKII